MERPHRVVVALESTDGAAVVLLAAFEQASHRPEAEVHAVHVLDEEVAPTPDAREEVVRRTRATLREWVLARLTESGGRVVVTVHVRVGPPATQIRFLAQDVDADVIVVGTHGRRGLQRLVLGSVAEQVVRSAPCPVLVVRSPGSARTPLPPDASLPPKS